VSRQLTHDFRHSYRGYYHDGGICGVRIYQDVDRPGTPPVLVLTELPENDNTSITNLIEVLTAELIAAYLPSALETDELPVVVEHYPVRGHLSEHYDRVTFDSWRPRIEHRYGGDRIRLGVPEWRRLMPWELEALISPMVRP